MIQVATIQMELRFIDRPDGRRRVTTGGPMSSREADAAHKAAIEAAEAAVREHGFTIIGVGHGCTAAEYAA